MVGHREPPTRLLLYLYFTQTFLNTQLDAADAELELQHFTKESNETALDAVTRLRRYFVLHQEWGYVFPDVGHLMKRIRVFLEHAVKERLEKSTQERAQVANRKLRLWLDQVEPWRFTGQGCRAAHAPFAHACS